MDIKIVTNNIFKNQVADIIRFLLYLLNIICEIQNSNLYYHMS